MINVCIVNNFFSIKITQISCVSSLYQTIRWDEPIAPSTDAHSGEMRKEKDGPSNIPHQNITIGRVVVSFLPGTCWGNPAVR